MEPVRVEGIERYESVYVSTLDDSVWVNVQFKNGSAHIRLTVDAAEKLIAALQSSISGAEAFLDVRYQNEPVGASE